VMWSISRRTISPKAHAFQLVYGDSERWPTVERVKVSEDQVNAPSLTDDEVVVIAKLARAAEKHYGYAQDIEWSIDADLPDGDNAVLLQARPETVWSKKPKQTVGKGTASVSSIVDTLLNPLHERKGK